MDCGEVPVVNQHNVIYRAPSRLGQNLGQMQIAGPRWRRYSPEIGFILGFSGADEETRTPNLLFTKRSRTCF